MNIAIIGCGVYSMAMAKRLSKNSDNIIKVWTEDPKKVTEYKKTHQIKSIFKDEVYKDNITLSNSYEEVLKDSKIIFLMISANFMRDTLKNIKPFYKANKKIIIGTKGIDLEKKKFFSETIKKVLKTYNVASIAGPSFAIDILNDEILALTVATKRKDIFKLLELIYKDTNTKLERSKDLIGVQLSSTLKNIYAIGAGMYSGFGHSEATNAIYLTRILNETNEILYTFNCDEFTIMSYASLGDTILTCSDEKSRNYTYGKKLTSKRKTDALNYLTKNTVEGYAALKGMYSMVKKKKINAPILYTLYDIIYNNKDMHELEKELLR